VPKSMFDPVAVKFLALDTGKTESTRYTEPNRALE